MLTKPLLNYPRHPEFEELLNSCGSMTTQLERLGYKLSVTILAEREKDNYFSRYTTLNLDNTPVVIACSQTKITNQFFYSLLKNANTTPIGKFLFSNSLVHRLANMVIDSITAQDLEQHQIMSDYIESHKYQQNQEFWQRKSFFEYSMLEQFELIEVLLPELKLFFR